MAKEQTGGYISVNDNSILAALKIHPQDLQNLLDKWPGLVKSLNNMGKEKLQAKFESQETLALEGKMSAQYLCVYTQKMANSSHNDEYKILADIVVGYIKLYEGDLPEVSSILGKHKLDTHLGSKLNPEFYHLNQRLKSHQEEMSTFVDGATKIAGKLNTAIIDHKHEMGYAKMFNLTSKMELVLNRIKKYTEIREYTKKQGESEVKIEGSAAQCEFGIASMNVLEKMCDQVNLNGDIDYNDAQLTEFFNQ